MNEYTMFDDYAEITVTSEKFGVFKIKIDKEDAERCKEYHWSINLRQNKYAYATNREVGLLHRFIMKINDIEYVIDHINGDFLDNRKSNLRACRSIDNSRNRNINKNNSSGVKGVFWYTHCITPKWVAYIRVEWKRIHLGYFDKLEDAILARKEAELKYFGEFSRENPLMN
jgi:hypothetical protein